MHRVAHPLQKKQLGRGRTQGQGIFAPGHENHIAQLVLGAPLALGNGGQGKGIADAGLGQGPGHGFELALAAVDEEQIGPGRTGLGPLGGKSGQGPVIVGRAFQFRKGVSPVLAFARLAVLEHHPPHSHALAAEVGHVHGLDARKRGQAELAGQGGQHVGIGRLGRFLGGAPGIDPGQFQELFLLAAPGRTVAQGHAPPLLQDGGQGLPVALLVPVIPGGQGFGHDQARRDETLGPVELEQGAARGPNRLGRLQAGEKKRLAIEEPPLAYEQDAQPESGLGDGPIGHIQVHELRQHRGLPLHGLAHGLEQIAQFGRAFEGQGFGRLLHFPLHPAQHLGRAAGQKRLHPAHEPGISCGVHGLDARGQALADGVVQAGPNPVGQRPVPAFAQGKHAPELLPGGAGRGRRGERPEIGRAVALHPPGEGQSRIGRPLVELEQNVVLVVLEHDIIARPVFLDQARFEEQGLFFRGRKQHFHGLDPGNQGTGLGRVAGLAAKIRTKPGAQAFGLAHVQDLAPGAFHQINTRRSRKILWFKHEHGARD